MTSVSCFYDDISSNLNGKSSGYWSTVRDGEIDRIRHQKFNLTLGSVRTKSSSRKKAAGALDPALFRSGFVLLCGVLTISFCLI